PAGPCCDSRFHAPDRSAVVAWGCPTLSSYRQPHAYGGLPAEWSRRRPRVAWRWCVAVVRGQSLTAALKCGVGTDNAATAVEAGGPGADQINGFDVTAESSEGALVSRVDRLAVGQHLLGSGGRGQHQVTEGDRWTVLSPELQCGVARSGVLVSGNARMAVVYVSAAACSALPPVPAVGRIGDEYVGGDPFGDLAAVAVVEGYGVVGVVRGHRVLRSCSISSRIWRARAGVRYGYCRLRASSPAGSAGGGTWARARVMAAVCRA